MLNEANICFPNQQSQQWLLLFCRRNDFLLVPYLVAFTRGSTHVNDGYRSLE